MEERIKNLVRLALVILAVGLVLKRLLKLSVAQSMGISAVIVVTIVVAFNQLLGRHFRKHRAVLRTENHPDLGAVKVLPNRWEALVSGAPFEREIGVVGESQMVSDAQVRLFRQIRERYNSLLSEALSSLAADLRSARPPLSAEDLELEGISIDDEGRLFTFTFGVVSRAEEFTDSFYVDFADFKVEEAGWVH